MASLYRCRGSADEMRTLFDCEVEHGMRWRSLVRPRQSGLVIRRQGKRRVAQTMHWGMPSPEGSRRRTFWAEHEPFSNLAFGRNAVRPRRCLIILDCFTLPDGPKGHRTRSWFGLWDAPLFAWAGLWRDIEGVGPSFIGAVTDANALVKRVASTMPAILKPDDYERWLFGTVKDVLPLWRRPFDADALWLEQTDELWSRGLSLGEIEAERRIQANISISSTAAVG